MGEITLIIDDNLSGLFNYYEINFFKYLENYDIYIERDLIISQHYEVNITQPKNSIHYINPYIRDNLTGTIGFSHSNIENLSMKHGNKRYYGYENIRCSGIRLVKKGDFLYTSNDYVQEGTDSNIYNKNFIIGNNFLKFSANSLFNFHREMNGIKYINYDINLFKLIIDYLNSITNIYIMENSTMYKLKLTY